MTDTRRGRASSATSATGGPLIGTAVQGKERLENVFHTLICGLTGLTAQLVRPRYQRGGPSVPPPNTNWCAFGISRKGGGGGQPEPAVRHISDKDGHDLLVSHKSLDLLLSFYGPEAEEVCDVFIDGLGIEQNRYLLRKHDLGFASCSDAVHVPGADDFGWLERWDITLTFNRQTRRRYEVKNLLAAPVDIQRS